MDQGIQNEQLVDPIEGSGEEKGKNSLELVTCIAGDYWETDLVDGKPCFD